MSAAEAILDGLRIWGGIGLAVAALFLTWGMDRINPDARGAYIFRPLLIPGMVVIWPLVLWRWYLYETGAENWQKRYDPPRGTHFAVGLILPAAICLIIVTGLLLRQPWPDHIAPVQLSQPVGGDG